MSIPYRRIVYVLTLILLCIPSRAGAADFYLDTTLLGQVRENHRDQTEVPVNGYLGLGFAQPTWNFSGETNMRLFRDFDRKLDDYDLYQAVLHIRPLDPVLIDFGRQFVNEGFSVEVIDGIRLTLTPLKYVDFILYTGVPRSVEVGDFNENDGLLSGLSIGLKEVERTNAQVHLAWRKNNIRVNDVRENDSLIIGVNLSHQWNVSWRPFVYGLAEYNVTGESLDAGTVGFDVTPHSRLSFNVEFNFFDVDRSSDRRTILGLFTRGRLLTGRFATTVTLIPDTLDFTGNYAYQNVEVPSGGRENGHLLDLAFPISFDSIGLHIAPGYYFAKSFGGDLHGVRVSIHEQFTERLYAEAGFDFTTFDKVTNVNDDAFSTVIWTGYEVLKGLTLSGGFEFNRNQVFDKDIRGSFKLTYTFDSGA